MKSHIMCINPGCVKFQTLLKNLLYFRDSCFFSTDGFPRIFQKFDFWPLPYSFGGSVKFLQAFSFGANCHSPLSATSTHHLWCHWYSYFGFWAQAVHTTDWFDILCVFPRYCWSSFINSRINKLKEWLF